MGFSSPKREEIGLPKKTKTKKPSPKQKLIILCFFFCKTAGLFKQFGSPASPHLPNPTVTRSAHTPAHTHFHTRAHALAHTLSSCAAVLAGSGAQGVAGRSQPLAEPLWAVPVLAAPWRCPRAWAGSRGPLGAGVLGRLPSLSRLAAPAGQVHGREPATLTFPSSGTGPADAAGGCGFVIKSSSFLAPSQPQHRARQPAGRNQPLADSRVDGEELRTGWVCGEGPEPPVGLAPGPSPAPRRFPAGAAEGTGSPAARRARAALPHIWKCALVKYWRRICEMRWHPRARTARIPLSHYF